MPSTSASPPSDMELTGDFYSGATSRRRPSRLWLDDEGQLILEADDERHLLEWHAIRVSPRVGNTPRYLHLLDDGVFETRDNDGVDALTRRFRTGRLSRWVHRLENHLGLILIAAVVAALMTLGSFLYGLPWTSKVVAGMMPASVVDSLSQTTLNTLDSTVMQPSTLSADRQAELRSTFAPYLETIPGQDVHVVFRHSDQVGANAMALPDGTIVFTDAMVHLAEDDQELVAVLSHELGHVAHNHGMQGVVHSSLTAWLLVMMTGDLTAFADTTVTGPAVLLNLAYSRDMERDADQYALDLMQQRRVDPGHFIAIMQRLEGGEGSSEDKAADWQTTINGLMSSHPLTEERIARFRMDGN
ncbi:M48 family metallopeptidase [Marinobacter halodurans]|uniref:M48 family metallopeptidase n=1 Tax=Marinobacter halodurans TaxID=2528979 RepID=A0ABY1ZR55_9GAMM|nr:M48 family metallopeptidase [Marinobacter halodurans]TBW59610.1 M48 family metallopeptidase [Marinobacter halodurans]